MAKSSRAKHLIRGKTQSKTYLRPVKIKRGGGRFHPVDERPLRK